MDIADLHPGLQQGGLLCLRCKSSTTLYYVNAWNPNGNAGRPYYKCSKVVCGKFATFADARGIHDWLEFRHKISCYCESDNVPRLQVAGQDRKNSRALHWVCATGKCDMFALWLNTNGSAYALSQDRLSFW